MITCARVRECAMGYPLHISGPWQIRCKKRGPPSEAGTRLRSTEARQVCVGVRVRVCACAGVRAVHECVCGVGAPRTVILG